MKIDLATGVGKIIYAVSAATVLGGGTMVLSGSRENAVQAEQIATVQRQQTDLGSAVKELNQTVEQLDKNVAVLNERLRVEK